MEAEGIAGELRCGYQLAGKLGRWQLRPSGQEHELQGVWLFWDPFWTTQRPLTLVLEIGHLRWTWPDVSLDERGSIAISSPPEEGIVNVLVRHS
jgi:hypothetical protein